MSINYKLGDLVWAKMKGFSIWPGKIAKPLSTMKKPPIKGRKEEIQSVFFFGSNNYAWIEESKIKPYQEFKETFASSCKTAAFKEAVSAIEEFIKNKEQFPHLTSDDLTPEDQTNLEFDKLKSPTSESKPKKERAPKKVGTPKVGNKRSLGSDMTSEKTPVSAKKVRRSISNEETNGPPSISHISKNYESLLSRPITASESVDSPSLLINNDSQQKDENVEISKATFGFLGLGVMGTGIVNNLIKSGHKIVLWNRTPAKCEPFARLGATIVQTPCDVIEVADITFSCVADPQSAKDMVFGNCGVLHAKDALLRKEKAYVEMTSIDAETSKDIYEAITSNGGRYLEAQIQGNKAQAEDGTLIILTAGDKTVFKDCNSCFKAMCKTAIHLGEVGNATKLNLVLQLISGVALAGLAEGMAMADRAGLTTQDVCEVLQLTNINCPLFVDKCKAINDMNFTTAHHRLKHMQKDLKLSMDMADLLQQPVPLASQANSVYTHAVRVGYGSYDTAAVFLRSRF